MPPRAVGLGALGLVLAACSSDGPSVAWECHCEYTTDTDVPGVQDVRVCVAEKDDPKPAAAECAQGLGLGQVERCECPTGPETCDGPKCEQTAAKNAR